MKIEGKIIKKIFAEEGDIIDLQTPEENREILRTAIWKGEYAIIKQLNGNVYDFLFRPPNRRVWELLALETRYGEEDWCRHISPYKIGEHESRSRKSP